MDSVVLDTARMLVIAIRDSTFDGAYLEEWVRGRSVHEPDLYAAVVMVLAAWCSPDDDARDACARDVFASRDVPPREWCGGCGAEIVCRDVAGLPEGARRKHRAGLCVPCYQREHFQAKQLPEGGRAWG